MKRYPMVEVHWADSSFFGGWERRKAVVKQLAAKDLTCVSAGYLLHESKDRLVLGLSLSASGNACDLMLIPRSAITRVRRLKGNR